MHSKSLAILAAAVLAQDALAVNVHRHGHQQLHEKRRLTTEITTVTDYVTVTEFWSESSTASPGVFVEASHSKQAANTTSTSSVVTTSSSSSSSVVLPPTTSSTASSSSVVVNEPAPPAPTTSEVPTVVAVIASTSAAPPPPATTQPSSGSSSGGPRRGAAYNDGNLLNALTGSNSKISWSYNWAPGDQQQGTHFEHVPMLWGPTPDHSSNWGQWAQEALNAGSGSLLGFNEPDNAGQSNLSPGAAAAGHIQFMNPFGGKASIGSPAITNSGSPGEGIDWLQQFFSACGGQCKVDFVACHWYGPPDTSNFLNHLVDVHNAAGGLDVWVTEFAPVGASDDDINSFLNTVLHELDTNPTYSFVKRVAYFMVATGSLMSSPSSLSSYGNTFVYGA